MPVNARHRTWACESKRQTTRDGPLLVGNCSLFIHKLFIGGAACSTVGQRQRRHFASRREANVFQFVARNRRGKAWHTHSKLALTGGPTTSSGFVFAVAQSCSRCCSARAQPFRNRRHLVLRKSRHELLLPGKSGNESPRLRATW